MGDSTEYVRLHIAPLSAALLPTIIPPSILPHARNITYHELQAFPDKPYGFVDLPTMDAAKLKTKLNGSILKGQKIKIESARPKFEHTPEEPEEEQPKRVKHKRKRDEILGAEIGERSVKRGWTDPTVKTKEVKTKEDKKKVKSKFTTEKECLFKTVLPPNVEANLKPKDKKKKSRGKSKETLIHEFEKTTKYPSFLRASVADNKKKGAREFVEGKGWVDEDGEVIEAYVTKAKSRKSKVTKGKDAVSKKVEAPSPEESCSESEETRIISEEPADDTSTSGSSAQEESDSDNTTSSKGEEISAASISSSSSEEESDSDEETIPKDAEVPAATSKPVEASSPGERSSSSSSSSSSSDSDSESDSDSSEDEVTPAAPKPTTSTPIKSSRPVSSAGLTIQIPSPANPTTTTPPTIHPLEALYKKSTAAPDATPKPSAPAFSFFGADADNEDGDEDMEVRDSVPFTPYTQREFEFRGQRSAAPTPDTAHGNKRFLWPTTTSDSDGEERSSPVRKEAEEKGKGKGKGKEEVMEGGGESDFQKWFYEHRGDTSRAWKKRRREVAKEKRQRENRKRPGGGKGKGGD